MEFNNKKLKRTSTFINRIISIILCIFLIGLTSTILDDLDPYDSRPQSEDFLNENKIDAYQFKIDSVNVFITQKVDKIEQINISLDLAKIQHQNAQESFNNWIKTRKTTHSTKSDVEIQKRIKTLDTLFDNQQVIEIEKSKLISEKKQFSKEIREFRGIISEVHRKAEDLRYKAQKSHNIKIFLYRLLFILPILILGIYFFIKKRKHKYSPIYIGFTLFSLYAFFFGLVPYLPSYGGYIRYIIGIILCIFLGRYAINRFRQFMDSKKKELETPSGDRAKKIKLESAEMALDKHICPSCGKDFLLKSWNPNTKAPNQKLSYQPSKHCRFCGLQLFDNCKSCNTENFIHLPFCSTCGDKTES